jgi:uncharacterized protein (UPF0297 family)
MTNRAALDLHIKDYERMYNSSTGDASVSIKKTLDMLREVKAALSQPGVADGLKKNEELTVADVFGYMTGDKDCVAKVRRLQLERGILIDEITDEMAWAGIAKLDCTKLSVQERVQNMKDVYKAINSKGREAIKAALGGGDE